MRYKTSHIIFSVLLSVFLAFAFLASAGSLTPSAYPTSTMNTLEEIYNSVASTFDSSGLSANANGSVLQMLKYVNNNLFWASSTGGIYLSPNSNLSIGTSSSTGQLSIFNDSFLEASNINYDSSASLNVINHDYSVQFIGNDIGDNVGGLVFTSVATSSNINKNWGINFRASSKNNLLEFHYGTSSASGNIVGGLNNASLIMAMSPDGPISIGTTTFPAKLTIQGAGSASSTVSLSIVNSTGTQLLHLNDAGNLALGTTTTNGRRLVLGGHGIDALQVSTIVDTVDTNGVTMILSAPTWNSNCVGCAGRNGLSVAGSVADGIGIEKNYQIVVSQPTLGSGASLGKSYGIYLGNFANATSENWAIYSLGGPSYLDGSLSIGTTTTSSKLTIESAGAGLVVHSGGQGIRSVVTASTSWAFAGQSAASTYADFIVYGNGTLWWGNGIDAPDTRLYRSATETLTTLGAFTIGGATSSARLSIWSAGSASTTQALSIFNSAGTNIFSVSDNGVADIRGDSSTFDQWGGQLTIRNTGATGTQMRISFIDHTAAGAVTANISSGLESALGPTGYLAFSTRNGQLYERMRIATSGYIGIGTTTPARTLYVVGGGAVCSSVDASCPTTETAGDLYATTRSGGAIDVAEWIKTSSSDIPQPGEIVVAAGNKAVTRSSEAYQKGIVGVVSTQPHLTMGSEYAGEDAVRLALTGRVPVKVSLENGQILAGDTLTSSSQPGKAMKAKQEGPTIGIALEDYLSEGQGDSIMVLISLGYHTLDLDSSGQAGQWLIGSDGKLTATTDLDLGGHSLANVKSLLSQSGNWSIDENGKIIGQDLDIQRAIIRSKLMMIDEVTGQTYCVKIRDGEFIKDPCVP